MRVGGGVAASVGVGIGVAVGTGVDVGLGAAVGVGVGDGRGVDVGVGPGVGDGSGAGDGVGLDAGMVVASAPGGVATVGVFAGGGVRLGLDVGAAACVGVASTVAAAVAGAGVGCGWLQARFNTRQQLKRPRNIRKRLIRSSPESVGTSRSASPLIGMAAVPSVQSYSRLSICQPRTAALRPQPEGACVGLHKDDVQVSLWHVGPSASNC